MSKLICGFIILIAFNCSSIFGAVVQNDDEYGAKDNYEDVSVILLVYYFILQIMNKS